MKPMFPPLLFSVPAVIGAARPGAFVSRVIKGGHGRIGRANLPGLERSRQPNIIRGTVRMVTGRLVPRSLGDDVIRRLSDARWDI